MFILLKLFGTIPFSSYSCDKSASALRRQNNYLQCTWSKKQLSALALIQLNFAIPINKDHVYKPFFTKKKVCELLIKIYFYSTVGQIFSHAIVVS